MPGALVQFEDGPQGEGHDGHPTVAKRPGHLHGGGPAVQDDGLPVGQEAGGGGTDGRLGLTGFEGANAVRGLLGTEEDARRPAVHPSEPPVALQRLEVAAHGHLGAVQCGGQLPDQHRAALTERLHDHLMAGLHIHNVQTTIIDVSSNSSNGRCECDRLRRWSSISAASCSIGTPGTSTARCSRTRGRWSSSSSEVCSPAWHAPHDRGCPRRRPVPSWPAGYPQFAEQIGAWSSRSEEMIGGVIAGTVEVLGAVRETGLPCYALTNMEAETYPLRLRAVPLSRLVRRHGRLRSGRGGQAGAGHLPATARALRSDPPRRR